MATTWHLRNLKGQSHELFADFFSVVCYQWLRFSNFDFPIKICREIRAFRCTSPVRHDISELRHRWGTLNITISWHLAGGPMKKQILIYVPLSPPNNLSVNVQLLVGWRSIPEDAWQSIQLFTARQLGSSGCSTRSYLPQAPPYILTT